MCGEHDSTENLLAAGALHACKSKLNIENVIKLAKNWRESCLYW